MADFKNILNGTFGKLVDKAKEVVDSSNVRDIYAQGATRAKSYGRIAKLTLELNGNNDELKRIYAEIGKLYYQQAKDAPEGYFAPLFAQAEDMVAVIAAKEAEIAELKAEMETAPEADIDVEISEFEEVVAEAEAAHAETPAVEEEAPVVVECTCEETEDGVECVCTEEEAPAEETTEE